MIEQFLPQGATRVLVHLEPVNLRWGPERLRAFCTASLGRAPDSRTAFLFINRKRDTMLLYYLDDTGEQTLTKRLEKGAFLLPAADSEGSPWATLKRAALPKLFRS